MGNFHILNQAALIRKYGDKYPDPTPENGKKLGDAIRAMTPEVDGISLADVQRTFHILTVLAKEVGTAMKNSIGAGEPLTDAERNSFKDMVIESMANHEATCPPDAKKKMFDEFMAIMQGNAELKAEKDAAEKAKFDECDADKDGLLNYEEFKNYDKVMRAWRTERYGGHSANVDQAIKDRWFTAANEMTPGADGISYDNIERYKKILMMVLQEKQAGK